MQHSGAVHRVQPIGDLAQQHQHPAHGQCLPGQLVGQIGAFDVRHHQVRKAAIVTGVDDGQHTGVVDRRGHPPLLVELAPEIGIGGTLLEGNLDGHYPRQGRQMIVDRPVDHARSAAADHLAQAVPPDDHFFEVPGCCGFDGLCEVHRDPCDTREVGRHAPTLAPGTARFG